MFAEVQDAYYKAKPCYTNGVPEAGQHISPRVSRCFGIFVDQGADKRNQAAKYTITYMIRQTHAGIADPRRE